MTSERKNCPNCARLEDELNRAEVLRNGFNAALSMARREEEQSNERIRELEIEADAWKASAEGGDAEETRLENENDALKARILELEHAVKFLEQPHQAILCELGYVEDERAALRLDLAECQARLKAAERVCEAVAVRIKPGEWRAIDDCLEVWRASKAGAP